MRKWEKDVPYPHFFFQKTGIIPESIYNLYMPFINSNSIFMISGAIINANIKRERAMDMGKYEYNFVEVPFDGNLKNGNVETIEKCKDIIRKESAQGWRLVQIISPSGEKRVLTGNSNYEIVFEREN